MRVSSWLYLIEQTCCGACLLTAVGLSAGLRRLGLWRILLTSSLLSLLPMAAQSLPAWVRLLLLPLTALAPMVAFPDAPRRLRPRMALLSAMLSLWLTGLLRLLAPLALPGAIALMLGCAALAAIPRTVARASDVPLSATVDLRFGMRQLTLTALIDSGNLLRDAVTGLPVIVISRRAAAKLLPLPSDGALLPGMRLMNVRTIAGTSLMTILRPDGLRILTGGQWQDAQALIGLSPDGYEGFQALVPACLVARAPIPIPRKAISQGG